MERNCARETDTCIFFSSFFFLCNYPHRKIGLTNMAGSIIVNLLDGNDVCHASSDFLF